MAGESVTSAPAEFGKGVPAESPASPEIAEADDQGLEEEDTSAEDIEGEESTPEGSRPLIFISYRHGSDQPIASALKLLLKRSLAPSPEVFVASEGGIRPSQLGYKSQLQAAVQRATAFIGVITQASKDREWLYFEAGAAWGQGKLYAPLLVEMSATELNTTLSDLHTTNARSVDEVRRLLDEIASQIHAQLKDRFGSKYVSFARSFQPRTPVRTVNGDSHGTHVQIAEIVELRSAGKLAEADALIAKLEAEADDLEARARIRISIILKSRKSNQESLIELERLPVELAHTAMCLFWKGLWETSSETALSCLRDLIVHKEATGAQRRLATIELAKRLYDLKRDSEATAILLTSLSSEDRGLRGDAAELWCECRKTDHPLLRFSLAGFGHRAYPSTELLTQQVQISLHEEWPALAIFCAESTDETASTGGTANDRGRAYQSASLWSLAYGAYQGAVTLGASVARVNMASIAGHHAVAAVGIQLLDQHQGSFDAATPSYPYDTRAKLEQALYEEKERRGQLHHHGKLLSTLLIDIMELAIRSLAVKAQLSYTIDGEQFNCSRSEATLVLTPVRQTDSTAMNRSNIGPPIEAPSPTTPSSQTQTGVSLSALATALARPSKIKLHQLCEHIPVWEATIKERKHILTFTSDGALVGISLTDLAADDPDPRPVKFEGTTSGDASDIAQPTASTQSKS